MNEREQRHGIHADLREGGREMKRSEDGGKRVAKPAVKTSWEKGERGYVDSRERRLMRSPRTQ